MSIEAVKAQCEDKSIHPPHFHWLPKGVAAAPDGAWGGYDRGACDGIDGHEAEREQAKADLSARLAEIKEEIVMERLQHRDAHPVPTSQPVIPQAGSDATLLAFMGTDALKWTKECMYVLLQRESREFHKHPDRLEDLLLGWFANAIEAGRTAGYSAGYAASAEKHGCTAKGCMLFGHRAEEHE